MAESAHETINEPEVAYYAVPEPGETVAGFSLRAAILTLCDDLAAATGAYALASAALAGATIAEADARLTLDYREEDLRARAYRDGLPGTNEAQRAAFLAIRLADDPDVGEARQEHDRLHRERLVAEHDFRLADVRQKALRARLYALASLVRGGGA